MSSTVVQYIQVQGFCETSVLIEYPPMLVLAVLCKMYIPHCCKCIFNPTGRRYDTMRRVQLDRNFCKTTARKQNKFYTACKGEEGHGIKQIDSIYLPVLY